MKTSVSHTLRAVALISLALAALLSTSAQAGSTKTVGIRNFAFHPGTLTIAKGTKVSFSNTSGIAHTATDRGAFDTGRIANGDSVAVRFTQKGTFPYHCKIHPTMQGKIIVN
jgi:plastocyanin